MNKLYKTIFMSILNINENEKYVQFNAEIKKSYS